MHESQPVCSSPFPPLGRLRAFRWAAVVLLAIPGAAFVPLARQDEPRPPPPGGAQGEERGPRGGRGPQGGGPGQAPEVKLVQRFDKDADGRLDRDERAAARAFLREEAARNPAPEGRGGFGGPGNRGGPPGMRRGNGEPPKPGARVDPALVKQFPEAGPYEPGVLRSVFLDFENADWEKELVEFHNTDVEVPARLVCDGKQVEGVGVRFRGASSYFMVGDGYKRSLNVSVDFSDKQARVLGVKTLNLLNSNGDPSFLRAVLYSHIARAYLPAPNVNLVRVVINGENWGVYANAEQFNKDFLKKWFPKAEGVRWKVPGSPRGGGGLVYQGEDPAAYQRQYEIKTENPEQAKRGWTALIKLCRTLKETPADQLEAALAGQLDVDGALRFLAVENATMNSDGYWIRASDFCLFLDEAGVFHVIPHDMNECFQSGGGPGAGRRGRGGPGGPGGGPGEPGPGFGPPPGGAGPEGGMGAGAGIASVDPLAGADDPSKPLLSALLAVPSLRQRYLGYMADLAERGLDWKTLEPVVARYRSLIEAEVAADTRKLDTTEAFRVSVGLAPAPASSGAAGADGADGAAGAAGADGEPRGPGPRRTASLQQFVEARRQFLLAHPEIAKLRAKTPH